MSEKDLRVASIARCKDMGVKFTGKGGIAGEFSPTLPPPSIHVDPLNLSYRSACCLHIHNASLSFYGCPNSRYVVYNRLMVSCAGGSMDVFTVCNVLQACGVLEESHIPPSAASAAPSAPPSPSCERGSAGGEEGGDFERGSAGGEEGGDFVMPVSVVGPTEGAPGRDRATPVASDAAAADPAQPDSPTHTPDPPLMDSTTTMPTESVGNISVDACGCGPGVVERLLALRWEKQLRMHFKGSRKRRLTMTSAVSPATASMRVDPSLSALPLKQRSQSFCSGSVGAADVGVGGSIGVDRSRSRSSSIAIANDSDLDIGRAPIALSSSISVTPNSVPPGNGASTGVGGASGGAGRVGWSFRCSEARHTCPWGRGGGDPEGGGGVGELVEATASSHTSSKLTYLMDLTCSVLVIPCLYS